MNITLYNGYIQRSVLSAVFRNRGSLGTNCPWIRHSARVYKCRPKNSGGRKFHL